MPLLVRRQILCGVQTATELIWSSIYSFFVNSENKFSALLIWQMHAMPYAISWYSCVKSSLKLGTGPCYISSSLPKHLVRILFKMLSALLMSRSGP